MQGVQGLKETNGARPDRSAWRAAIDHDQPRSAPRVSPARFRRGSRPQAVALPYERADHGLRLPRATRVTVIASRFNPSITRALARGAIRALRLAGIAPQQIRLIWVPGAFELPVAAARVARSRPRPHAIVAVGALIRGATAQYDVIAQGVAQGLSHVAVESAIPVTFGVVVASTAAQARARAGGAQGNRGAEAAQAAIALLQLFDERKI